MKEILVPITLPDFISGINWEKNAIDYAKQVVEDKLREEFKKNKRTLIWSDLEIDKGFWIDPCSKICKFVNCRGEEGEEGEVLKSMFLAEKHAKAALAMAQISQLMPYYGGEITSSEWNNSSMRKYVVTRNGSILSTCEAYTCYEFTAFRTEEYRNKFMSREENMRLIKDYYMMD